MRLSEELNCAEFVAVVTDYLEGALSPRDRQRFEEHIGSCNGCANHLDHMQTTIAVTGRLTEDDLAPETAAELLGAFRDWKRG